MKRAPFIGYLFLFVTFGLLNANDPATFNIQVFPHSHQDYGWLNTIEEYFNGTENGCVKCIFDGVFKGLAEHSNHKFFAETTGFLRMWWNRTSPENRQLALQAFKRGQIEVANGGITMNDEACTYYDMIIDQFTLGQQWLKETFNYCPKYGWSIDPFGHSKTHAWILAKMAYDSHFVERIHVFAVQYRKTAKTMDFLWKPWHDFNETIFTEFSDYQYSENVKLPLTDYFLRLLEIRKDYYLTHNLHHHWGGDFHWRDGNLSKIETFITEFNKIPNINATWGTFRSYISSVHEEYVKNRYQSTISHKPLTVFEDDYFPYMSYVDRVWTGFYTSKPWLKGLVFDSMRQLLGLKNLCSKILLKNFDLLKYKSKAVDSFWELLWTFDETMSFLTHHDAVTGTSLESVDIQEYEARLRRTKYSLDQAFGTVLKDFLADTKYIPQGLVKTLYSCGLGNDCATKGSSAFVICNGTKTPKDGCFKKHADVLGRKATLITVFNPGNAGSHLIKLGVSHTQIAVLNQAEELIKSEVFCLNPRNESDCLVYFKDVFDAFQIKTYQIITTQINNSVKPSTENLKSQEFGDHSRLKLKFLTENRFTILSCEDSLLNLSTCLQENITLEYKHYIGRERILGVKAGSGSYLFNPEKEYPQPYGKILRTRVFRGELVSIIQFVGDLFESKIIIRSDNNDAGIEIQTHLDPLPTEDKKGKEIVLSITADSIDNSRTIKIEKTYHPTKIMNTHTFHTDSNGLFMVERIFGYKEGYEIYYPFNFQANTTIQFNYYPITSAISIEDIGTKKKVTLMNDRSQGGSSSGTGRLELMLHRVSMTDDDCSLNAPLKDIDPYTKKVREVDLKHYLLLSKGEEKQRKRQYLIDNEPLIFFAPLEKSAPIKAKKENTTQKESGQLLPQNLKVAIRPYKGNAFLIRLHNLNPNQTLTVGLFGKSGIVSTMAERTINEAEFKKVEEVTISGHRNLADAQNGRLRWTKEDAEKVYQEFKGCFS